MTLRAAIMNIVQHDALNFALTNRIPRRFATRTIGWFSRIEHPVVCRASIWVWRRFTDLDLSDAAQTRFASMHECFTRRLQPGARPVDPDPALLVSPCDAIVGACGTIEHGQMLQVKGMPYTLRDLTGEDAPAEGSTYVTLRLSSAMYHHFHAPYECRVDRVTHIWGDTWNVNGAALRRVERLFCRNERAVIRLTLANGLAMTLVPVAAILVAGIRLTFPPFRMTERRPGTRHYVCDTVLAKGAEMGWFEHGSTIVAILPPGVSLLVQTGQGILAGQALGALPQTPQADGRPLDP